MSRKINQLTFNNFSALAVCRNFTRAQKIVSLLAASHQRYFYCLQAAGDVMNIHDHKRARVSSWLHYIFCSNQDQIQPLMPANSKGNRNSQFIAVNLGVFYWKLNWILALPLERSDKSRSYFTFFRCLFKGRKQVFSCFACAEAKFNSAYTCKSYKNPV